MPELLFFSLYEVKNRIGNRWLEYFFVDLYNLINFLSKPTLSGIHTSSFSGISRNQRRAFKLIVILSAASLVELASMSPNRISLGKFNYTELNDNEDCFFKSVDISFHDKTYMNLKKGGAIILILNLSNIEWKQKVLINIHVQL